MTMEERKAKWINRIDAWLPTISWRAKRNLLAICVDVFNEGREAGLNEASENSLLNLGEVE